MFQRPYIVQHVRAGCHSFTGYFIFIAVQADRNINLIYQFFMTGITRLISSSMLMGWELGRVDSPPISMISAPSAAIRLACCTAAAALESPSPEKDSGLVLTIPMMKVRSPQPEKVRAAEHSFGCIVQKSSLTEGANLIL